MTKSIFTISDDKCLLQNMDLVGENLLTVKGVSSTFDCVNLCLTQPGCEAVVWITRTDTCLVKGYSPEAHLTTSTWVANSQGGAGVVVFLSCLEAAQIAMKSIEEAERRRNAENIKIAGVAENIGGYENKYKVVNGEVYVESENEKELEKEEKEARSGSSLDGKLKAFSLTEESDEPTETMDESSVRNPTETMDESTVRKPTETMDESTVRKPTETMDESTVRNPTEKMDESSVRNPTETMDESTVRKPEVSSPGVQHGQDYGNTQFQWYNPDQWIRTMLEPVLSWWSWGSSPEKEDTSSAAPSSSSSTYSTSSSTYFTSSSTYFTSSSSYFTSSRSSNSRSSSPNTDPAQNKLLQTIETIGNWTVSAIQTIFTALSQAVTSKIEIEEEECEDSAKFCNVQLCNVEVVSNMCKKTCRSCPEKCRNLYSDTYCVFNAGLGHCQQPEIAAKCLESCGKCADLAVCQDLDPDFCRRYGKFHCWNQGVREMCSRSCFVC